MSGDNLQSEAQKELKRMIDRIENLETEKKGLSSDINDIYLEAKGRGFDAKIMKKIVAMRRRTQAEIAEEQAITETYMAALGMLGDTPLGEAGLKQLTKGRKRRGEDHDSETGELRA
jgi:uncharacterized protein (UPF0335 family)